MLPLKPRGRSQVVGRLCSREASDRHFHCAPWLATTVLASVSDSLVRVSRRGIENHFLPPGDVQSHHVSSGPRRQEVAHPHRAAVPEDGRKMVRAHWFPTVPFQQFQALFNSLFRVLFIFPSHYFFAIGLPPVFSLRWNLPPALSCNPKQLDSDKGPMWPRQGTDGIVTLSDALFQETSPWRGV